MEAYVKLTDNVFSDIRNCPDENLKDAQDILDQIDTRDLYKLVGEAIPKSKKDGRESIFKVKLNLIYIIIFSSGI